MTRLPHRVAALTCLGLAAIVCSPVVAEESAFDFRDPKGVNAVSFLLDSPLEPIAGLASGISGKISFDPEKPKRTSGSLTVEAATLHTQNSRMTEVLHSEDWLDVKSHEQITFAIKKIKKVITKPDGAFEMTTVGDFTCKGTTKKITVDMTATHLPEKLAERMGGQKGDLLVLRSEFTIQRKDYGIKPEYGPEVVAETIQLSVAIVGILPKE